MVFTPFLNITCLKKWLAKELGVWVPQLGQPLSSYTLSMYPSILPFVILVRISKAVGDHLLASNFNITIWVLQCIHCL
jgi:hypothetical protein